MALSQVQCLDENHINWRLTESKPEFFFSEEQRVAVESLLSKGLEAFYEVIKKENIRNFLSELEIQRLLQVVEKYQPGSENVQGNTEQSEVTSLEYWPARSDITIPALDMGWPDSAAYRGVTRANVYTQPPMDGQTHIKEVVRKMIGQAQKVIAVVMDIFTDVDIFKDMLDVSFKKKVPVYIILDGDNVKQFLQMCERAGMHVGHLKNLRVRCIGGTEFYTRTSTMIRGVLSQKFMFVDGDRAISGSYSFTWAASRIDRNIITVLSGQAVETFDKQFQQLYMMSKDVNLKTANLKDEPEPEPVPHPSAPAPPPSAQMVKKMINPKYALVRTNNDSTASSGKQSETKQENDVQKANKNLKSDKPKAAEQNEVKEELSPTQSLLLNLEKVSMFDYLPIWPEPEPDNSVIGFINIREPTGRSGQPYQNTRIQICEGLQTKNVDVYVQPTQETINQMKKVSLAEEVLPPPTQALREIEKVPPVKDMVQKSATDLEVATQDEGRLGPIEQVAKAKDPESTENSVTTHQTTGQDVKPPIPKPRTVSAVHIIGMQGKNKTDNLNTVKETNGPRAAESYKRDDNETESNTSNKADTTDAARCPVGNKKSNSVTQNGIGETYENMTDQESFSDASSTCEKSNISSASEEYWDCQSQRRNSDYVLNGLADKLKTYQDEGCIGRGTFKSSRKSISRSLTDLRGDYKPENLVIERSQRALERSQLYLSQGQFNQRRKDHRYHADTKTTKQITPYDPRTPATALRSSRDKHSSYLQSLMRSPDLNKSRKGVTGKPDLYQRPTKKTTPVANDHKDWKSKIFPNITTNPTIPLSHSKLRSSKTSSTANPVSASQTPESYKTPFGISYSKLSQSRHLKNKLTSYSGALGSKTSHDSMSHRGSSQ